MILIEQDLDADQDLAFATHRQKLVVIFFWACDLSSLASKPLVSFTSLIIFFKKKFHLSEITYIFQSVSRTPINNCLWGSHLWILCCLKPRDNSLSACNYFLKIWTSPNKNLMRRKSCSSCFQTWYGVACCVSNMMDMMTCDQKYRSSRWPFMTQRRM